MALTRKYLEGMGLTAEQVEAIIGEHVEATNALITQRDTAQADAKKYKAEAEKVPDLEKKLEDAGKDDYKEKYESTKKDFDAYKETVEADKSANEKKALYRDMLKSAGVKEKYLDTVIKATDFNTIEVKDGALVDADKLTEGAKTEWADFVAVTGTSGAKVEQPIDHTSGGGNDFSLAGALKEKYMNE